MHTIIEVLTAFRTGSPAVRVFLRQQYPRLQLEFDAIEYDEDRAIRRAARITCEIRSGGENRTRCS